MHAHRCPYCSTTRSTVGLLKAHIDITHPGRSHNPGSLYGSSPSWQDTSPDFDPAPAPPASDSSGFSGGGGDFSGAGASGDW